MVLCIIYKISSFVHIPTRFAHCFDHISVLQIICLRSSENKIFVNLFSANDIHLLFTLYSCDAREMSTPSLFFLSSVPENAS